MGCQDLLEEVPGRSRSRDSGSSPADLKAFMKGVTGRSSSKSYSIKDETSSECKTMIFYELSSTFFSCEAYFLSGKSKLFFSIIMYIFLF